MDQIESESLYDERGDVSRARPLLQGDVFDGIVLPGFGDQPMKVQIINHPCAMRTGANLAPRITVAPVEPYPRVTGQRGWDGNLRVMPLPELTDEKHFATKLVDVTAAPAELLTRARRIATLSHQGIYVLQQRLIKHYTRVDMPLELLRRESASVLAEGELQWDWVEEVLTEAEQADESAIEAEAKVFDVWMGEGDPSPRELLRNEIHHADVRRQAQRTARDRSRGREGQN
jgi:hypothetical protein